ncbi:MAG: sulfate/molybdate ABC transporter ATP-binding protein [Lachnospiraceae bacterium]|jgi:molybdate transport system ATP-binding protein
MALSVSIEKKLGAFHLNVDLEADERVVALLGASGAGKSMTLKCIAGIERPDKGRIVLNGKVLFDSGEKINLSPQKRKVGYLFQNYALFPNMTVEQNIACGIYKHKDAKKIRNMISTMHLQGLEKHYPRQLSGGQQQRTALARILINEPDVLMLDEPFSALDTHLRYEMEQEVRDVIQRFDKPVLLVSHNRDEVYRLSNRVAVINNGRIEVNDEKGKIFSDPRTVNAAILCGYRNISAARAIGKGRVYATDWDAELDVAGDCADTEYIGVRTENVYLAESENTVRCKVTEAIQNPFTYTLMVSPERSMGSATFAITVSKPKWERMKSDHVIVSIPKEGIVLLKK